MCRRSEYQQREEAFLYQISTFQVQNALLRTMKGENKQLTQAMEGTGRAWWFVATSGLALETDDVKPVL